MNKTININLGGFFFHIDETAYSKLKRYLESISRSLSDDPQGKNEIISDIEARISELLSERITDARQVVNESDIEEVIAIMGQPEDYADAEEGYAETNYSYQRRNTNSKKLFRSGDDKFLGGVAAGLGHYFGIDTIWVRLIFLVLGFSGGAGIPLYIILWILLPEAQSTAEKLQMEGEAVNIDNIEKKIRDEFNSLSTKVKDGASEISDKISSADYAKLKQQSKSGLQEFLDTIGKIFLAVFKVFGKFIGVILLFVAAAVLLSLIIGLFSVGSIEILNFDNDFVQYPPFFYDSILPKWLLTVFGFLLIGIPFLILFILGLRILSSNVKQFSKTTSLTLLGLWLVALFTVAFSGIEFATSHAYNGTKIEKSDINIIANDTLKIKMVNDDNLYYQHNLRRRTNSEEVHVNDVKMAYSNNVKIDVKKSETNEAYIEIHKESNGRNRSKANKSASEITYKYTIEDKNLTFDAYFLSDYRNIWKDEEIKATVYVPEGVTVYFHNSTKRFLYGVDNLQDVNDKDMSNQHFTMTPKGFDCNDCEEDIMRNEKEINQERERKRRLRIKADGNSIDVEF
ncbi:transcriptional regulator [Tenacibaculum todarodis]|uniref:Transcriptional regulator n=1 Tax=Tenacibaculum todarodis TaxID=1850252 RepID=A0A1L3JIQ6_9FLAO|nr:PspC domain-containing protein [Tenacibaculum todarodis]APG64973.1 transcriptional regulator [Tenacibaculum todarodis]